MKTPILALLTLMIFAFPLTAQAQENSETNPETELAPKSTVSAKAKESPWHFDGNMGVPTISAEKRAFAFDVDLDYLGEAWLWGLEFSRNQYELGDAESLEALEQTHFLAHLGWGPKEGDHEFLLELDIATYSSTKLGDEAFSNESTANNRFLALYGYRGSKAESFAWTAYAGLGYQTDTLSIIGSEEFEGSSSSSPRFIGRFVSTLPLVAGSFKLRTLNEVGYASTQRIDFAGDAQVETLTAIESKNRFFVDATSYSLMGMNPSAYVGVDYYSLSGGKNDKNGILPLVGLGLTH